MIKEELKKIKSNTENTIKRNTALDAYRNLKNPIYKGDHGGKKIKKWNKKRKKDNKYNKLKLNWGLNWGLK